MRFAEHRYQDQRGGWHCLSHNAGSAGFANLTLAGGHAFSEDLHTWYTTPTPAYTGAFVEQAGGAHGDSQAAGSSTDRAPEEETQEPHPEG